MKQSALKIINPILIISFLIQFLTIVSFVTEFGRGSDIGKLIFEVHKINGFVMVIVAITHLAFNWKWVVTMLKGEKTKFI